MLNAAFHQATRNGRYPHQAIMGNTGALADTTFNELISLLKVTDEQASD
jgi:hypothetical protein